MGSYTYSKRGIVLVSLLLVVLGIISACSVKKDFHQTETIKKTDTTKTFVNLVTKDSTHVTKKIVHIDSTTKTQVRITPIGEFSWNSKDGYKGQASEFYYYEEIDYARVFHHIDSMTQHRADSLQIIINGLNEELDRISKSSSNKGSETPIWAYMLFIALVGFVLWQILK